MAARRLCFSPLSGVARRGASTSTSRFSYRLALPSLPKQQPASAVRRFASFTAPGLALGASAVSLSGPSSSPLSSQRPYANVDAQTRGEVPPESIVSFYQLGFGSVAGICVGIFVKKGLKAVAFVVGGLFVLLQYMSSRSFIKVDWRALGSSYDSQVNAVAGRSKIAGSRAAAVWNRFADFLVADFPPRATFMAGLLLGLRIG